MASRPDRPTRAQLEQESSGRLRSLKFYGAQVVRLQSLLRRADHELGQYFAYCLCAVKEPCAHCQRTQKLRAELRTELAR